MLISHTYSAKAPLRILIADDDRSVLAVMHHVVEFLGHHVVGTAINGKECIRRTTELRPDLVIVDLAMRGLDGIETAKAILKIYRVPIILITGASRDEALVRLKNIDIADLLTKPFTLEGVKMAIEAAVERRCEVPAIGERISSEVHAPLLSSR